jgi:hypothetical protein
VHTDEPEAQISRQVEPYRRRRRAAIGAMVCGPVVVGASAWLFFGQPSTAERAAASVFADDEEPSARLAADDPIGAALTRIADDGGAAALRGVSAAADAYGVLALWTDRVVWVSRDDGRSLHQELAGPEPLTAVAVGPEGRVYAARHGGRLGVLSPAARTHWLDIGCEQVLAIDAAPGARPRGDAASVARAGAQAPWLAVLGLHRDRDAGLTPMLWLSSDHGRSWRRLLAPHHGDAANRVQVRPDGVIHLVTEDTDTSDAAEPGGRLRHYIGHVDGRPFELALAADDPPMAVGHDGHSWRMAWKGRRMMISGAEDTAGALSVRNWDVRLAASRERTLAVADGRLVQLGGDGSRVLSRELPGELDALAVDGLGRALAAVGGSAVRYSERHGWRRLFEIRAP